jgi:Flp pilus assembly protein CpaB
MPGSHGSAASVPRRRSHRASTYFLVGVLAICAAGGWYLWQRGLATRIVCVATADMPAYHQITMADVQRTEVPLSAIPSRATADPEDLVGRYTLVPARRGRPLDLADLGPRLPAGALSQQLVIGLPVSISDLADGAVVRGDRVDILLSSTAAASPRNGVLRRVLVLNVKSGGMQPGHFLIVCAIPDSEEYLLLLAGGTARIFVARVSQGSPS